MAEYYLWIKNVHIGMAYTTGLLFLLRGLYRLLWRERMHLGLKKSVDRLSYLVDTLLLAMGISLLFILKLNPVTTAWVASKLVLLIVYVGLGVFAFRQRLSLAGRWSCFALALVCWLLMYQTARLHLPIWMWS